MGIGELVRAELVRAGLSVAELARTSGVPQRTCENILSGARRPRADLLIAVLRACGSDLGVLARVTPPPVKAGRA